MSPDPFTDQKWEFELWEHEKGKSRAGKEYFEFKNSNPSGFIDVGKGLIFLQGISLLELQIRRDIKKIKNGRGLYEIRFLYKSANIRFVGYINEKDFLKPKFFALLFFYKKSNDIPQRFLKTAYDRLEEFKLYSQYEL